MTDDLVAFINGRLDEDEAAAKACAALESAAWSAIDENVRSHNGGGSDVVVAQERQTAEHIARHDPARALREVAAKRRIVWDHTPQGPARRVCSRCHYGNVLGANWPCLTMTSLAGIWSDHPDYQQRWQP